MTGHNRNVSELWKNLPWKKFRKDLFRLQKRLFKAIEAGDKRKALRLQRLILKSRAARFLAIRQVTQLNTGKKTAGVDGVKSLNFSQRFDLEITLGKYADNWKHQGLREIPIPKKDGTSRMLKIPTIADRAWQCLAKYALEPAHEATFHKHSYGFRTGRSAHDAQQQVFLSINSRVDGANKRVIELDIEKCFDRISHKAIMDRLMAPKMLKTGIFRCLKAGVNLEFPEQGTPQGGVISPLLANIALNGIESIHRVHTKNRKINENTKEKDITYPSVRYADDMVIFLRPQDDAEEILRRINEFLAERGMRVSPKKTKVTATTDGFDFLGWNFKIKSNGKYLCVPSEDNFKKFQKKVKDIVNCPNYGANEKAKKIAPIIRGWREYHKYCDMSSSRFSLWFMNHRAFTVFNKEKKMDRHTAEQLIRKAFPRVGYSLAGYNKVKGNKSPYDGDINYWSERNSKLYDGITAKLLRRQKHTCGQCGMKFMSDERVHLHHIDGNHNNWRDKNLVVIHESCHDYLHMGKSAS